MTENQLITSMLNHVKEDIVFFIEEFEDAYSQDELEDAMDKLTARIKADQTKQFLIKLHIDYLKLERKKEYATLDLSKQNLILRKITEVIEKENIEVEVIDEVQNIAMSKIGLDLRYPKPELDKLQTYRRNNE